ncbi:ABC transporter permease [Cohnella suwonensis]|uniref:ABC transporter permease n=1 Tax=Cohnella suwonensis TaxID=696072 RepID=A0ABW0LW64_9BACL
MTPNDSGQAPATAQLASSAAPAAATSPKATRRKTGGAKLAAALVRIALPLFAGALFLLAWERQLIHRLLKLKLYQLPLPSAIWTAIRDNQELLLGYTRYTLTEAVLGMLAGSALGFAIALVATAWPRWGAGGLLVVAALNAVPIVALAPTMNLWFGDGMLSRAAIVAATTAAAMAINAHKGMRMVDPLSLDLMRAYAAGKSEVFLRLRIPNSLPYVFAALKINATASMIGAIVGEFFFSSRGLGYLLSNSIKVAKMPLGWSCIVVAAIAGILFYLIVEALEKIFAYRKA